MLCLIIIQNILKYDIKTHFPQPHAKLVGHAVLLLPNCSRERYFESSAVHVYLEKEHNCKEPHNSI